MHRLYSALSLAFCLALAGCAGLFPEPPAKPTLLVLPCAQQPAVRSMDGQRIAIGPVQVPDYLKRTDLFLRTNEASGQLAPRAVWSEQLDSGIARALAANLSVAMQAQKANVFADPFPLPATRRVFINVIRFDGHPDTDVVFQATWSILSDKSAILKTGSYVDAEPAKGSISGLVNAHGELLKRFAAALAPQLAK